MVEVDAADYVRLAKALRGVDKKAARAFRKRLREAAGPIGRIIVETGSEGMPSRGGLRARLQASRPGVSMTGSGVGINLRKGANFSALNRGILRHPVFGGPGWAQQDVPADAYTAALQHLPPETRARLTGVMADIIKELGL